uniref:Aldedh domain-containing protein n=1 Tax=Heterorhabditis bacteriophora TaxID=37862 RepID=A0A1I7XNG3_HETBA
MIVKDPLGVILIVSPWNYPVSMILLPLIPAIAAGINFLAVVNGGIPETTELLKERFDHILYTGCPPVAKIIMAAASKHLTPVTLELGGKCPVIIEDDADIEISARRIAWGKWLNCGQTCLAPDYAMVTDASKQKFVDALRKYIGEFYGNDIKESKDYSRIINDRHFEWVIFDYISTYRILKFLTDFLSYSRLSSLLDKTNGTILFNGGSRDRDDLFIPPIILGVNKADPFMNDEVHLIISCFKRLKFVSISIRFIVDTLPFGGVGNSGMGRYRGKFGFNTFTHEKAVLKRGFFGESLQE